MLKKHLIILLLLVSSVGLFAQSIPSGTGRYEALGYNPFIMDAATDINRNPAWAGMYYNYAFGDIGTATSSGSDFYLDNQYAGINFHVGKMISLGAVFNKDESMWSAFNDGNLGGSYRPDSLGIKTPVVPLKILFSWSNKKMNIGLAPYFAMWSSDATSTDTAFTGEDKRSSLELGGTIGIISHMNNNKSWVEGDVNFKMDKYKKEVSSTGVPTVTYDNTGGIELGAMVRGWFYTNSKINVVPYVGFSMFSWTPEISPSLIPNPDISTFSLMGGIGINMPILDQGMLAGGVSSGISSYKLTSNATDAYTFKVTTFTLPQFNIGMEWNFTEWLVGRTGYSRSIVNTKYEATRTGIDQTYSESIPSNPDQTITLGLGWSFGRFSLDGLIGEKFFQRAPYIVSGHPTDLYGVLSASYNFNKK